MVCGYTERESLLGVDPNAHDNLGLPNLVWWASHWYHLGEIPSKRLPSYRMLHFLPLPSCLPPPFPFLGISQQKPIPIDYAVSSQVESYASLRGQETSECVASRLFYDLLLSTTLS